MSPWKVILVRSSDFGWTDIRLVIESTPTLCIVGEAITIDHALKIAADTRPDLILLGTDINGVPTAPFMRELCEACCHSKLVICAGRIVDDELLALAEAGVRGYLTWSSLTPTGLYHCLGALLEADITISSAAVSQAFLSAHCRRENPTGPLAMLSMRQLQPSPSSHLA